MSGPVHSGPAGRRPKSSTSRSPGADPGVAPTPRQPPVEFELARRSLESTRLRPEILLEVLPAPTRLAPWAYAVGAEVYALPGGCVGTELLASGRLVLLCDPAAGDIWDGTLRLVSFATAELDPDMAGDPLLPEVGWSWLHESLVAGGAAHTALGGTVTQTASQRFGDLAGPPRALDLELRASWTPLEPDLGPHLRAWADLLCAAAGLPPPGVTALTGFEAPRA